MRHQERAESPPAPSNEGLVSAKRQLADETVGWCPRRAKVAADGRRWHDAMAWCRLGGQVAIRFGYRGLRAPSRQPQSVSGRSARQPRHRGRNASARLESSNRMRHHTETICETCLSCPNNRFDAWA